MSDDHTLLMTQKFFSQGQSFTPQAYFKEQVMTPTIPHLSEWLALPGNAEALERVVKGEAWIIDVVDMEDHIEVEYTQWPRLDGVFKRLDRPLRREGE